MSQQEASIQNQTTELSIVSYQNWIVILMELGRIYFLYFYIFFLHENCTGIQMISLLSSDNVM